MQDFLLQAAVIAVGGGILLVMTGILWVVGRVHGLLYSATNGDEDSFATVLVAAIQGIAVTQRETRDEIKKHHKWSTAWARKAEKRRREESS